MQFFAGTCKNANPFCEKFDPNNGDFLSCWENRLVYKGRCPVGTLPPVYLPKICYTDPSLPRNIKICFPNECELAAADGTCLRSLH